MGQNTAQPLKLQNHNTHYRPNIRCIFDYLVDINWPKLFQMANHFERIDKLIDKSTMKTKLNYYNFHLTKFL